MSETKISLSGVIKLLEKKEFTTKLGELKVKYIATFLTSDLNKFDLELTPEQAKDLKVGQKVEIENINLSAKYYDEKTNRFSFARVSAYIKD